MKSVISSIKIIFLLSISIFLSSCGDYNDISIKDINKVKFRGLNQKVILLNIDLEIDNPNTRKISVTEIEFQAWLNNRVLGDFRISEPIKLTPCSKQNYSIPIEIELRTIADAFRLVSSSSIEAILDKIEVEGHIKAKSFPVRKKILVKRQPFTKLTSTF